MKLIVFVAIAAVGGVMVGNFLDEQVGETIAKDPGTRNAVKIGFQAGSAAMLFGLINAMF